MITLEQIESVMLEHQGEDVLAFVEQLGIDGEAAGLFCANMARAALDALGVDLDDPTVGPALVTVGLSCFEAACRAIILTLPGRATITGPTL